MSNISALTAIQLDVIKEVANVGAGNAATALSKLLGTVIEMDVPKAEMISIYELSEYYGSPTTPVASVFVRSDGKFSCSVIFMSSEEGASDAVAMWMQSQFGEFSPSTLPDDMLDSGLAEVGNIIIGSFLNAINVLIDTTHRITVPSVVHDMMGSILDVVSSLFGMMGDVAIVANTTLRGEGADNNIRIDGNLILIPDPDSLELLFRKLQVL